jgi:hypothetical protein
MIITPENIADTNTDGIFQLRGEKLADLTFSLKSLSR